MTKTKHGSKQPLVDSIRDVEEDRRGCEKRVRDLERENESFQKEIEELRLKLENASSNSSSGVQKLKEDYLQKLTLLEDQVSDLKNKLEYKLQFSVQRPKGDEATKQLQFEIQSLKAHKVQLLCKMKVESLQFRLCKASLEKEVLQIKREGRRNQYEMQKLLDNNQILKLVLQRKSLEASIATKRLRDLLESRKALSQKRTGATNGSNPAFQVLENELDLTAQLHALCSEYERQMDVMVEENAKLKEEVETLKEEKSRYLLQEADIDTLEKDLDIKELKEQVVNISDLLRQLRVQKNNLDDSNKSQGVSSDLLASVASSDQSVKDESIFGSEHSETSNVSRNKSGLGVCCSCSKRSLCKTTKCQCRNAGGSCGTSCGCTAAKCTNRESSPIQLNDSPLAQAAETKVEHLKTLETVKSALLDEPAEKNDHLGLGKKPLCDIGNIRLRRKA